MHFGNFYLNIFIVLNLYLAKLVQLVIKGLILTIIIIIFLMIQVICGFHFRKIKIHIHSSQFLM